MIVSKSIDEIHVQAHSVIWIWLYFRVWPVHGRTQILRKRANTKLVITIIDVIRKQTSGTDLILLCNKQMKQTSQFFIKFLKHNCFHCTDQCTQLIYLNITILQSEWINPFLIWGVHLEFKFEVSQCNFTSSYKGKVWAKTKKSKVRSGV